MLFDLEPYLPFNAFVVLFVLLAVVIVGIGTSGDRRRDDSDKR